jgi:hypothetical protein
MRLLKLAALVAAFVFLVPIVSAFAHEWYATLEAVKQGQNI